MKRHGRERVTERDVVTTENRGECIYLIVCKEKHGYCVVWIRIDLESGDGEATRLYFITRFRTPVLRTLRTTSFNHSETKATYFIITLCT